MGIIRIDRLDGSKLGWRAFEPNDHQEVHVVPVNDLVAHDDISAECACLPVVEPIVYSDEAGDHTDRAGEFTGYYHVLHNAWDGRE